MQFYRELAKARLDAFQHDLAVSLAVLAHCLETVERVTEALTANQEAIERLREPFLALPPALMHWMRPMVQQYLGRCTAQRVEPDGVLLEATAYTHGDGAAGAGSARAGRVT